jgi:rRNA-processing protein FCF1
MGMVQRKRRINLDEAMGLVGPSKLIVLRECIDEVRRKIPNQKILPILEKLGVEIIDSNLKGPVDDLIVEFAEKNKAIVLTLDLELKRRLVDRGIPVIYLRAGKKLVLEAGGI